MQKEGPWAEDPLLWGLLFSWRIMVTVELHPFGCVLDEHYFVMSMLWVAIFDLVLVLADTLTGILLTLTFFVLFVSDGDVYEPHRGVLLRMHITLEKLNPKIWLTFMDSSRFSKGLVEWQIPNEDVNVVTHGELSYPRGCRAIHKRSCGVSFPQPQFLSFLGMTLTRIDGFFEVR